MFGNRIFQMIQVQTPVQRASRGQTLDFLLVSAVLLCSWLCTWTSTEEEEKQNNSFCLRAFKNPAGCVTEWNHVALLLGLKDWLCCSRDYRRLAMVNAVNKICCGILRRLMCSCQKVLFLIIYWKYITLKTMLTLIYEPKSAHQPNTHPSWSLTQELWRRDSLTNSLKTQTHYRHTVCVMWILQQ